MEADYSLPVQKLKMIGVIFLLPNTLSRFGQDQMYRYAPHKDVSVKDRPHI